jgi:hypothetical protein
MDEGRAAALCDEAILPMHKDGDNLDRSML